MYAIQRGANRVFALTIARGVHALSFRAGFALAVGLLLLAAFLRLWDLPTLPSGFSEDEITDIRIAETIRLGNIEVYYDLGAQGGREGLYHIVLAAVTSILGNGPIGYHMLSVWVSLLTLAAVYALAVRLFGPLAGVAALALLAVNLPFILVGREVGREVLLPGLVTGVLVALARALAVYKRTFPRLPVNAAFGLLGALLGVGFYIHPVNFLILLFSLAFVIYRLTLKPPLSSQTNGYLRFSLLLLIIIATPYLISSIRLPDLSGVSRLWGDYQIAETSPVQSILDGFGGVLFRGDANPTHNLPGRPLIDLISGVLLLIGLLTAGRAWRQPRYALPLVALLCLLPAALLAPESPNFQRFMPLLPLIALFFGLGVATLYRSIISPVGRRLALLAALGLLLFNVVWLVRDLFHVWPAQAQVYTAYNGRLAQLAYYLDRSDDDKPTVICDSRLSQVGDLQVLTDTDLLLLMMNRENLNARLADCGIALILVNGGDGQQMIFSNPNMLANMHPYLRDWMNEGEALVGLPEESAVQVAVAERLANRIGLFTTTAPVQFAPEAGLGETVAYPPVQFGGNITFLGYERPEVSTYRPGDILTSITYWRVDGIIPPDLRLFTHILADPAASPTAQTDVISVDVSGLQPRDVFIQITFVPLPLSMPSGTYTVSIGAYQREGGERMAVLQNGTTRGTSLFLGQITVR